MNQTIHSQRFDEERALYNLRNTLVKDCRFEGPADGESAFKEARNIAIKDCTFSLRYPLWHTEGFAMEGCSSAFRLSLLPKESSTVPLCESSIPVGL